ncbi:hypothetical protein GGF40_000831 [Coemansia sp. RSA 1286]|nr:hypothetical protein IWW45_007766 [Coemansia sp. RSA 485]KAJ2639473.1 hypothetical protein GGF40_000831 [Coemansia sp. RSA 1286]
MPHMNIRRSSSHRLPKRQSQSQGFAKASSFSPGSRNALDWEHQAMLDMGRNTVTNSSSDNDTENVSCGQSNSPSNGRSSNTDSHVNRCTTVQPRSIALHRISANQDHHRVSISESVASSKVKAHSHDGTLTRQSSVARSISPNGCLNSRMNTNGTRFFRHTMYQQHQQQSLLQHQQALHVPNDSPDLLNSRQLRRQFARYSNNLSPNFDEEQMIAFNGPGNNNLHQNSSTANENRDAARLSDDSTSCEDSEDALTVLESLKNAARASWLNVLIVFVPLGYVAHFLRWPVISVFVLNYLAIIPLSALMGFATEEVSIRFGPTWGGVINAAFGNAVELIVAVIALIEEEYRIVQAGLIGSVLSNTLLVLGCAFVAGGLRHRVQLFHAEAAQCAGALLALSVLSMIIPAAYHGVHASGGEITNGILIMSRGTALILLVVYILFLIFQLKTHSDLFDGTHTQSNVPAILGCCGHPRNDDADYSRSSSDHGFQPCVPSECYGAGKGHVTEDQLVGSLEAEANLGLNVCMTRTRCANEDSSYENSTAGSSAKTSVKKPKRECHLRHSAPQMKTWVAAALLIVISGLVALSSDILVDSVEELTSRYTISHTFVGMILLPIASSAAEHAMSVTVAMRNKMDLCITVAVGSSMQMTLFVLPVLIIIAWILGRPLTLFFDDFETTTMLISVLVINYLIMNGRSNWLKGAMLLSSYFIVALAFFLYPNEKEESAGAATGTNAEEAARSLSSTASALAATITSAKLSFL